MDYNMIQHLSPEAIDMALKNISRVVNQLADNKLTPREALEAIVDSMEIEVIYWELQEEVGDTTPEEVLTDINNIMEG